MAYEYAKKGASLALVARREDRLEIVAETSRQLGSRDVITISGDVTKVDDCKKFIHETISHFGKCKYSDYTRMDDISNQKMNYYSN